MNADEIIAQAEKCVKYALDGTNISVSKEALRSFLSHIDALKTQLTTSQARERAAVEDMSYIANQIAGCREFLSGGTDKVNGLALGRCKVCKNICHEDKPCKFEWRGPQEAGEGETGK